MSSGERFRAAWLDLRKTLHNAYIAVIRCEDADSQADMEAALRMLEEVGPKVKTAVEVAAAASRVVMQEMGP
jgi:hypothetical protein